jgi:asparagine synthetase B (glutamine-hydrolysing)
MKEIFKNYFHLKKKRSSSQSPKLKKRPRKHRNLSLEEKISKKKLLKVSAKTSAVYFLLHRFIYIFIEINLNVLVLENRIR